MIFKKLLFLALACLAVTASSGCYKSCVDEEVMVFFEREFSIIEDNLGSENVVGGRSMIAVFVLQNITDIQSSVRFGDTSVYPNRDAFHLDKSKWKKWLDENGCELDTDHVESTLQEIKKKHPYLK